MFSNGYWNLNRLFPSDFRKEALLKVNLSAQKLGIFCISETYLSSSNTEDDEYLRISGYD